MNLEDLYTSRAQRLKRMITAQMPRHMVMHECRLVIESCTRVTVDLTTYVFVDPASAELFAQYARTSNALDAESLFRDGVPLPLETLTADREHV